MRLAVPQAVAGDAFPHGTSRCLGADSVRKFGWPVGWFHEKTADPVVASKIICERHFSLVMPFLLERHRAGSQRRGQSGIDVLLWHMLALTQTAFLVTFGGKTPNRLEPICATQTLELTEQGQPTCVLFDHQRVLVCGGYQ